MARRTTAFVAAVLLFGIPGWADTYLVSTTSDSGTGSLRRAIRKANRHVGADTVTFAPELSGKGIRPTTPLPPIRDAQTTIDGDLNDDGAPDIRLSGALRPGRPALCIRRTNGCVIEGLSVTGFSGGGVVLDRASDCTIRACYLGVNLTGTKSVPNLGAQLLLTEANGNVIGGAAPAERNVIGAGDRATTNRGIHIVDSRGNRVIGNYVGLKRDGMKALTTGSAGIALTSTDGGTCRNNTIGGTAPGEGNVIGGTADGVQLVGASRNTIVGNLFGLAADGSTVVPFDRDGIRVEVGARNNTIGGTTPGSRNVFSGGVCGGIECLPGAGSNVIQGNNFGTNAAGTRPRRLAVGVQVDPGAGPQTIGGATPDAGNYFAPRVQAHTYTAGCLVLSGAGTVVRHNRFGILPTGRDITQEMHAGVRVSDVGAIVTDNTISHCWAGIDVEGVGGSALVCRNVIGHCYWAVRFTDDGRGNLGNLGNSRSNDDGGNVFRPSNDGYICNQTPNRIKAEGNAFGTRSRTIIDSKIEDQLDIASRGLVDYDPLRGGVHPTGGAGVLAVSGVAGIATGAGAEVLFALSAPADVTVEIINIAGRLVAVPARDVACTEGVRRVVWSRRTNHGTAAPTGRYLARVTARDGRGQQVCALSTVTVR
jgi:hypothetical protein